MKLPKIQEDEYPLKNTYFQSITEKPLKKYKTDKLVYDWQTAEVELISRIPDEEELLQSLIQLQSACRAFEVPHFYSYFFVNNILFQLQRFSKQQQSSVENKTEEKRMLIKKIKDEIEQLKNKKSKWHRIVQLIQLRENLVAKINKYVSDNSLQTVYTYLDDIRFINFQIIKKISEWSQFNQTNSEVTPFFLYEGNNYMIKMINDNTNAINVLNSKAVKFLSPPNPFYLSRDGNKSSMSHTQQTQIDNSMEILAKQKAQQLRMIINPPSFVSEAKNETNQLKKLKNQLENQKVQRIKNAYRTNFSSSSLNMRNSIYSNERKTVKQKNEDSEKLNSSRPKLIKFSADKAKVQNAGESSFERKNRFQKMIQDKQVAVVQELKNSQVRLKNISKGSSKEKLKKDNKGINKYISKVESLRKSVQQNKNIGKLEPLNVENEQAQTKAENLMRLSTMSNKNQLPKSVAQIKAPKPKIRLIMEKQSFVEDVIKTFLPPQNVQMYKSLNVRKSATSFFKPTEKDKSIGKQKQEKQEKIEKTEKEDNNIDIKPVTQYSRTLSASNLSHSNFLKAHSKTKTKNMFSNSINKSKQGQFKKNKDKSKSRSLSQQSELSLLKSPEKRFTAHQLTDSQYQTQTDNADGNLRAVNSKLRQLTIMSIYGKKSKLNAATYNPYQSSINKISKSEKKTLNKEEQKDKIDAQLQAVKNRLKDLSIKKIYDRKQSTKGFKAETVLVQKQKQIKNENVKNSEQLQEQQKKKEQMLQNMKQKDKRIQQLLALLKKQENVEQKKKVEVGRQQEQKLRQERQKKMKQIEQLKQKIKSENKLIKQQMEQQEKKYIQLKQKQYEMKEEEIMKKYQSDMQQMKQQYIRKNKELQAKVMEQQRIRKQQQIRMLKQQRQMQQLKMQMEQKRLKEQLLQEILRQHKQKQQREEKMSLQDQQLRKQKLKRELLEKQEMERKLIENFQQDNRKLVEMFEQMKRKNQEAEKQNQRKLMEIKRMEEETKREEQNLRKLQAQLTEARNLLDMEETKKEQELSQAAEVTSELEDIEQVKLRVKQQILREMMVKRKQQEEQVKNEKEERARKLAQIEEQIRNELKRQEEQMEKIQKEQRQKYERIKRELEEEHRRKMEQLEKDANQKQVEKNQQQQVKKEVKQAQNEEQKNDDNQISKQQYEEQLQKAIEASKRQAEQREKKIEEEKQKEEQEKKKEKEKVQEEMKRLQKQKEMNKIQEDRNKQQQSEMKKEEQKEKGNEIKKEDKIVNNGQKNKQEVPEKKLNEESPVKKLDQSHPNNEQKKQSPEQPAKEADNNKQPISQPQIKKQTQTIKQSSDEILTKYQNLQQYLSKCKQIYIDDKAFNDFLDNFYAQFAPEVKEMLPYSQSQIVKFVSTLQKKIDIFEGPNGHSVGWIEAERYVLIGQISCVQNIVRKYGQVQIQMTYIFNKTNPYQKQFLAKQVKIFDKVGYIFQKKLKEQNMFSIKLIIKVPSEILPKNFKQPNNQLRITQKIAMDMISKSESKLQNKKYSYSYILGQTLKNCLGAEQELQFKQDKSEDARAIQNKMHYKLYNDSNFKSQEIDDKKMKIEVSLPLKYMQTHQSPCYLSKGSQCINNSNSADKIYAIPVSQTLSMVAFRYDQSSEEFGLDILLNLKLNKLEKQRELLVCLPVWKRNQELKINYPGPKQFNYSTTIQANLAYGSIISNSVLKQQYIFMQAPFVFALYQTNLSGLLLRPLHGEVVESKDIVVLKR